MQILSQQVPTSVSDTQPNKFIASSTCRLQVSCRIRWVSCSCKNYVQKNWRIWIAVCISTKIAWFIAGETFPPLQIISSEFINNFSKLCKRQTNQQRRKLSFIGGDNRLAVLRTAPCGLRGWRTDWLERRLRGSLIVARGSPQNPGQKVFMVFLVYCFISLFNGLVPGPT